MKATTAKLALAGAVLAARAWLGRAAQEKRERVQCHFLRDIFNPFRPITINPSSLTSNVLALAATIYDNRAFDRLPELADALEAAGCAHADLLAHCRSPGSHVPGCWAVDWILDKN